MFILRHPRARWFAVLTLAAAAVAALLAGIGLATGEPGWHGAAVAVGLGWLLAANLGLLWAFVRLQMTHNAHVAELRASTPATDVVAEARRAAVAEVERVDALIQARIDVEGEATTADVAALRAEVGRVVRDADALRAAHGELESRVVDVRAELIDARTVSQAGLEEVRRMAADAPGMAADVRVELADLRRRLREVDGRLKRERSDRIVALARRSPAAPPRRLVVIVAPPRTGSTWLLDALRAHPAVQLMPTTETLEALGLVRMNRYPAGLSDGPDATLDVEVSPGVGARIPEFRATVPGAADLASYAVEKIHPLFFDEDTDRFLAAIERFQDDTGIEVTLLYRLRNPRMAVRSALRYQRRDPAWYRFVEPDAMPLHFHRSLVALDVLAAKRPGLASRYEDHRRDGAAHLARLFAALWPEAPAGLHDRAAAAAEQATAREGRSVTPFLDARTSDEDAQNFEIEVLVNRHAAVLDECVEVHERLLGRLGAG